jgi:hypothetical protein
VDSGEGSEIAATRPRLTRYAGHHLRTAITPQRRADLHPLDGSTWSSCRMMHPRWPTRPSPGAVELLGRLAATGQDMSRKRQIPEHLNGNELLTIAALHLLTSGVASFG